MATGHVTATSYQLPAVNPVKVHVATSWPGSPVDLSESPAARGLPRPDPALAEARVPVIDDRVRTRYPRRAEPQDVVHAIQVHKLRVRHLAVPVLADLIPPVR